MPRRDYTHNGVSATFLVGLFFTLIPSLAFGVSLTPTATCWHAPLHPDTVRMIECSETRVVYESPRGGLSPLRQFILEPKGGTGTRHVWDDVTGWPTAYPVKNHTPVSILTPRHSISYGEWIATVTAAASPTKTPLALPRGVRDPLARDALALVYAIEEDKKDKGTWTDDDEWNAMWLKTEWAKPKVTKTPIPDAKPCPHAWVTSPMHAIVMVDEDPEMDKRYGFMSPMHANGLGLREQEKDGHADYAHGSVGNFYGVGWVQAMVVPLEHCLKCGTIRVRPSDRKIVGLTGDQRNAILQPTTVARQRERCLDLAGRPLPDCTPTRKR